MIDGEAKQRAFALPTIGPDWSLGGILGSRTSISGTNAVR
jgi:hypothetical protein